ncbi:phage integrase [Providencia burhodogranariea DSM 19968]|uniref:Phage integrase n=1 Tax=Providencia burhodogranariea DSM 19968 TaxID=1141662 RepID=K8X489_9GAMM|nr:phage integrase [Providencia burhodogranariea DSM 19968]
MSFGKINLGEIRYILSVNNLPSHIRDPRKEPITIKNRFSLREILLDEKDYYYINELRNPLFINTDKSIVNDSQLLFITNRGSCRPITYDTVQKYYSKINSHYNSLYSDKDFHTLMPKITPHVGRHSWAYITLGYIYNKLFDEEVRLKKQYGINSRLNGLLDAASEQLRKIVVRIWRISFYSFLDQKQVILVFIKTLTMYYLLQLFH